LTSNDKKKDCLVFEESKEKISIIDLTPKTYSLLGIAIFGGILQESTPNGAIQNFFCVINSQPANQTIQEGYK